MARILMIFMALAVCVAFALILYSLWTAIAGTAQRHLRPVLAQSRDDDMAPTGIQKAAYIALIIVLFGVASGWLGGL